MVYPPLRSIPAVASLEEGGEAGDRRPEERDCFVEGNKLWPLMSPGFCCYADNYESQTSIKYNVFYNASVWL